MVRNISNVQSKTQFLLLQQFDKNNGKSLPTLYKILSPSWGKANKLNQKSELKKEEEKRKPSAPMILLLSLPFSIGRSDRYLQHGIINQPFNHTHDKETTGKLKIST